MKVGDLKGKTIGFAASGGLDSCTITRWLTDQGVTVVGFTADLAQPDEKNLDDVRARMLASGAKEVVLVPLADDLAEAGLEVIQAQAWYEGRYWNTTGIARHVIVRGMIPEMRKRNISILSHGATGRGNDQVRFQLVTNMLAPDFEVYAPWRDQAFLDKFGGRTQMIDFCTAHKLPITATKESPYSTDANVLGLTHEAGRLEALDTPARFIDPGMGCHPPEAPDAAESFTVRFEAGRPVSVNGKSVTPLAAIQEANRIGGRHGVGIGTHLVENRFVGLKSRGVYEAPGMELLGTCYDMLLQLVLDRRARAVYEQLSRTMARQIYEGYWFDVASQMVRDALSGTVAMTTGTIGVSLYKGTIAFESAADVPHSMYSEANASMEAIGEFNHADSEGFLRVLAVSARALAASDQIKGR